MALSYGVVEGWEQLPGGYAHKDVAGVAIDGEDRVYLICRGDHPIIVYDRKGNFLGSWGERRSPALAFPRAATSPPVAIPRSCRGASRTATRNGSAPAERGPTFSEPCAAFVPVTRTEPTNLAGRGSPAPGRDSWKLPLTCTPGTRL